MSHNNTDLAVRHRKLNHSGNRTLSAGLHEKNTSLTILTEEAWLKNYLSGLFSKQRPCMIITSGMIRNSTLTETWMQEAQSDICNRYRSYYEVCHLFILILRILPNMQTGFNSSWDKRDCELQVELIWGAISENLRAFQSESHFWVNHFLGQAVLTL